MDKRGLVFLLFAALATRFYALFETRDMFHFDGLYQVLEPAHKIVFGYGMSTWEFTYGMRSMVYPYLTAGIFKPQTRSHHRTQPQGR